MRILQLCNKPPWPPKDGGAAATLNMTTSLSDKKSSVTVLAMNTPKHSVNINDIPGEYLKKADFHFVTVNTGTNLFKLIINLLFSAKPYNLERFRSSVFEKKLKELLKDEFDIIQLEGLALHHYLPVIRKNSRAKIVMRSHNVENIIWQRLAKEETNPVFKIYFKILSRRLKRIERTILNDFDALITISNKDLIWFKDNNLSIPSLVSLQAASVESISANPEDLQNNVFFIGALDWRPNTNGLEWFIKKVWPLVLEKVPDTTFYIAGRNASKKTIIKFTGKNISYCGEVDSSFQFISDKSVMVVPLFSGSGIRMKIIEGMSLGKSIVTTSAGAYGLEYEDKKNIFIADSAPLFADYITHLLLDKDLRKETGRNAMENVRKNYDILASTDNLLKFYTELTS
jgi:polysaccharide biosynthesis protein PslH